MIELPYKVVVGTDLSGSIGEFVKNTGLLPCIISDGNCKKLFGSFLDRLEGTQIIIEPGEASKTRKTKEWVEDKMMSSGFGRDTIIVAVGGGVVGDLAGFVAATYTRGIPYINVPTTLLAMVDSSIGGKTGVDTQFGKNLVGAIWQPSAVFMDLSFITSLPDRELKSGLSELVKNALIGDAVFFGFLEKNMDRILAKDKAILIKAISMAVKVKADIVSRDERESGLRKSLNYGHTIGHAIETLSNYSLSHGEAVSIGMAVESSIAVKLKMMSSNDRDRQNNLLARASLPLTVPDKLDTNEIIRLTLLDKKARKGKPEYVVLNEIGKASSKPITVENELVRTAIEANR